MSDTVFSGWSESPPVVKDAPAVTVDFGNSEITFDSGFDLSDPKKLPAEGGVYLARLTPTWSGWNTVPTEGFASLQLVHVSGETETPILGHEVNTAHLDEGYGDGTWNGSEVTKLGLATVEGGGYFEIRALQMNTDVAEDLIASFEFVLVRL